MPKRTSAADATPIRVVIVTMDGHLASASERAGQMLSSELPGLTLSLHAASEWGHDSDALDRCCQDIAKGDIVIATMLFMEEHANAVLPALRARRDHCDAMVCCFSARDVMHLTRVGRFQMDRQPGGALGLLKRLRGTKDGENKASAGAKQMKMLKRLPEILRFIPGTAQDVRTYFLVLQYWLAGSDINIANMVRFLVGRYAAGERAGLKGLKALPPAEYPEVGLYHPRLRTRFTEQVTELPAPATPRATVGLLLMRSYMIAGNTAHYDAVINSFEARGVRVIPAFASGLDARPAVDRFFTAGGRSIVDAVVSLTGFSLVGGPAYNDAEAARDLLMKLDVPYIAAHALEFQTVEQWQSSSLGLQPVESTMMVAIPELDGATNPMVFGGRVGGAAGKGARDMQPIPDRVESLVARVDRQVTLRRKQRAERKIAIVLFNFPPNAGNAGTAMNLSVFASLWRTLQALKAAGYGVELPASLDQLRSDIIEGNSARYGSHANVHARMPVDDYVRHQQWLDEIEAQWGPAPGKVQSDGASLFVLGKSYGNVFVGVQPGLGYEGDPMRLLFEQGFAPTHAFAAFYRYLRHEFAADAVLHFGTHGALEFMPGKQTALGGECWPDRLIGDLPNLYLYAANNASEGAIAKRRSAATLVSYMSPPIAHAGLYRGLNELKDAIFSWRAMRPDHAAERHEIALLIHAQAGELDLLSDDQPWAEDADRAVMALDTRLRELEATLIPYGLHVVGEPMSAEERIELLSSMAESMQTTPVSRQAIEALVDTGSAASALAAEQAHGEAPDAVAQPLFETLATANRWLAEDQEIPALLNALDGRFVPPAPAGDVLRTPDVLPTGRNLHGFDPFRIPSAMAVRLGGRQADLLLARHLADGNPLPESVALVLWGTDNLKTEGGPIAQALSLLGARPRFDGYGRLAGAELLPLAELGRPRIDVVITLSGIFRDLLPLQTRLLAEAAFLAASADEPLAENYVRKHALAYQAQHGCDLETAALRVFSNDESAYGSNVNHMVQNGQWHEEDELAETYTRRKCFAYGRAGRPLQQAALLESALADVSLTYQNLESVELGVTTLDHYFDTLGGISRAVSRARGSEVPVYIGDQTRSEGTVRTLNEQVALEARTRMLNPKWYEGMLQHGYEGVRLIEEHVTNTMGWSATTGQVAPWVYQQLTQTFVLDTAMRERLARLNPAASVKVANRLLEAHERRYWTPDDETLKALQRAGEELEDRLEGITMEVAA